MILFRRHPSALAAQFLQACSDRRKIVSGAGSGHVSSGARVARFESVNRHHVARCTGYVGRERARGWKIGTRAGKLSQRSPDRVPVAMNLAESNEPDQPSSSTVSITVLSVTPAHAKKLFAFASVEIDIDGVQMGVHGIRAMREREGTAIDLPKFRDAAGIWRTAITLPEEVLSPIAKAVFDELVERGLTVRRPQR
jgi:stage V sporulation protein G